MPNSARYKYPALLNVIHTIIFRYYLRVHMLKIISRDRHAKFMSQLALIAGLIEQYATEIRHLMRTEIREVEEGFGKNQKGSSAMPHKKNPVLCENLCGLARVIRSNMLTSYENIKFQ